MDNQNSNSPEDKIDLIELSSQIWKNRKLFFKTFAWVLVAGLVISFLWPVEFESTTTLLPETIGSNTTFPAGNLLRSLGGFMNTDNSMEGMISKELYPEYIQSTPFLLLVSGKKINIQESDTSLTVFDYFTDVRGKPLIEYILNYTIGLPNILISLPDKIGKGTKKEDKVEITSDSTLISEKIYSLSSKQISLQNKLKERIIATLNENGTITISVKMPDPIASAQLAQTAVDLLTEFITRYRTEKFQENLDFISQRYLEARTHFNKAQEDLAEFRDKNANIVSARIQTEQQKLETEYQLAADLYQGMAQQLEQAKIKLQEEKPVFTILEPVQIPIQKTEPNRKLILFIAIFLGIVFGLGVVIFKVYYLKYKNQYLIVNSNR